MKYQGITSEARRRTEGESCSKLCNFRRSHEFAVGKLVAPLLASQTYVQFRIAYKQRISVLPTKLHDVSILHNKLVSTSPPYVTAT